MTPVRLLSLCGVAAVLALGTAACSDDSGGVDNSGSITFDLSTPNGDDGAVLLVITGPALSDVRPASAGYQLFWREVSATETRIIVVGDLVAGRLLTAHAPPGAASEFTASVAEIATRTDMLRPSTAGYTVTASR